MNEISEKQRLANKENAKLERVKTERWKSLVKTMQQNKEHLVKKLS